MDELIPEQPRSRRASWTIVFALNLIVPLYFGWGMTDERGRIGTAAAIGLLWYLGLRLCAMSNGLGRALVIGGFLMAFTQFFPFLHIIAGLLGVGLAAALGQGSSAPSGVNTGLGGLIATGLTGLTLMGAAAFCGGIVALMTARQPRVRSVPGSNLYDRQLDG